jgi:kynurenine formamidase
MPTLRSLIFASSVMAVASLAPSLVPPAQALDVATAKIIDLTHDIDANTIYWPTEKKTFELTEQHKGVTDRGFFYASYRFCSPEHGGTHIDAPFHFARKGQTTAAIPIERLSGPAVVIDISAKAAANPDYTLSVKDVADWEEAHGTIPSGAVVLLRTGWSSRWPDRLAYLGDDTPGDASDLHFPSYGPGAAKVLVERGVAILGVDTASIDNGQSRDFLVHRIAGAADVVGLENATNLDQLPATGAWAIILPMKITNGSGAPARAIALVP